MRRLPKKKRTTTRSVQHLHRHVVVESTGAASISKPPILLEDLYNLDSKRHQRLKLLRWITWMTNPCRSLVVAVLFYLFGYMSSTSIRQQDAMFHHPWKAEWQVNATSLHPESTNSTAANMAGKDDTTVQEDAASSLLSRFQFCRLTNPPLVLGEDAVVPDFGSITNLYPLYQCAGQPYDDFMQQHLFPMVLQRQHAKNWGQRSSMVPEHASGTSILILGNSHTRQLVDALLCQYSHQIVSSEYLQSNRHSNGQFAVALRFQLQQQLTLNVILNHPALYSQSWKENVEEMLQHSLQELDVIVLGVVPEPGLDHTSTKARLSPLWKKVEQYAQDFPHHQVDVVQYSSKLNLKTLVHEFRHAIVAVSMFDVASQHLYHEAVQTIQETPNRHNIHGINARYHVAAMQQAECAVATDGTSKVQTCSNDNEKSSSSSKGHRCVGDKGGEPDLLAWDVIEAFHTLLAVPRNTISEMHSTDPSETTPSIPSTLSGFHFCPLTDFPLTVGAPPVTPYFAASTMLSPPYQCAGKEYDHFMRYNLFPRVEKRLAESPASQWGRRPSMIPGHLSSAKRILILGNSHTQQMATSLLCHYQDQIVYSKLLQPSFHNGEQVVHAIQVHMDNELTVNVVINHPSVHSGRWKQNLEDLLQHPLEQLDAIVFGSFEASDASYAPESPVWPIALHYAAQFPQHEVDTATYPKGFTLQELAQVYPKTIVFVSMFDENQQHVYDEAWEMIQGTPDRSNIYGINARYIVASIMGGAECCSTNSHTISICNTNNNRYQGDSFREYRCMGSMGGEPDLLAWDVVETLHQAIRE